MVTITSFKLNCFNIPDNVYFGFWNSTYVQCLLQKKLSPNNFQTFSVNLYRYERIRLHLALLCSHSDHFGTGISDRNCSLANLIIYLLSFGLFNLYNGVYTTKIDLIQMDI